jgi:hypothetical protein
MFIPASVSVVCRAYGLNVRDVAAYRVTCDDVRVTLKDGTQIVQTRLAAATDQVKDGEFHD